MKDLFLDMLVNGYIFTTVILDCDHLFSVCAKFSEKLISLTPGTHTYVNKVKDFVTYRHNIIQAEVLTVS